MYLEKNGGFVVCFLLGNTPVSGVYMIYLLTAIGLSPGGSSTVHIYTQTIHRMIQNKQYIEQHNKDTEQHMPTFWNTLSVPSS